MRLLSETEQSEPRQPDPELGRSPDVSGARPNQFANTHPKEGSEPTQIFDKI